MPQQIERKVALFTDLKSIEDGPGGFEGHTSISGNLDDGGDIVLDGGFKDVLDTFLKSGFTAHSHEWNIKDGVIGYPMKAYEDENGLFISVKFHSTEDAQNVRTKMRERIADGKDVGLSIGYRPQSPIYVYPKDYEKELPKYLSPKYLNEGLEKAKQFKFVRVLPKISELKECSVVTSPMNGVAQVTSVKDSSDVEDRLLNIEEKLGARNSAGDVRKIKTIHDMAAELHPDVCSGYEASGKASDDTAETKELKEIFQSELEDISTVEPYDVWGAFCRVLNRIKAMKVAAGPNMTVDTTSLLNAAIDSMVPALRQASQAELDEDQPDNQIAPMALYGQTVAPEKKIKKEADESAVEGKSGEGEPERKDGLQSWNVEKFRTERLRTARFGKAA